MPITTSNCQRGREQFFRDRYPEYALYLDALEAKSAWTRAHP